MKVDDSQLLFKIGNKKNHEDNVTHVYASTDPSAAHKPITVYKRKNANTFLVACRHVGFTGCQLKYRPITDDERKLVVEKPGIGGTVKFFSPEGTGRQIAALCDSCLISS